jgi:hypothetical protein
VLLALGVLLVLLWRWNRSRRPSPLPAEWSLTARPLFTADERAVYRQLREALPHHIVLAKLPLVRFCQPLDVQRVRYWYDLLGSIHVSFAVCSANGRVLAAVDLETDRPTSRRAALIKQNVLNACRIRHLRCQANQLPSVAELQLLVPHQGAAARPSPPAAGYTLSEARTTLAHTVRARRAERTAMWQDSSFAQDSFFMPDSRIDTLFAQSDFSGLSSVPPALAAARQQRAASDTPVPATKPAKQDEPPELQIGGVVVDSLAAAHGSTR